MLSKVQRGLERLYRLTPKPEVSQFMIGTDERDQAGVARSPREQLLLQEDDDGLAIGLYLDPNLLGVVAGRGAGQLVRGQDCCPQLGIAVYPAISHRKTADPGRRKPGRSETRSHGAELQERLQGGQLHRVRIECIERRGRVQVMPYDAFE